MSHRTIGSNFVKSVLHNGVGRHVCQLQRLTLVFCKTRASSRGLRDFIELHLMDFTRENPGIVVYLHPKRNRPAKLVAEYLNGGREEIALNTLLSGTICQWVEHVRTRSGFVTERLRRTWHTDTPSVQGVWTPFTNKSPELNGARLPAPAGFTVHEVSASERLLALARQIRTGGATGDGGVTTDGGAISTTDGVMTSTTDGPDSRQ